MPPQIGAVGKLGLTAEMVQGHGRTEEAAGRLVTNTTVVSCLGTAPFMSFLWCRFSCIRLSDHVLSTLLVLWHVLSSNLALCVVPWLLSCFDLLHVLVSCHVVM